MIVSTCNRVEMLAAVDSPETDLTTFLYRHFGIDQDPIGQTLTLNKVSLTVIGIAPPHYNGMALEQPTEIWVPILMHPQLVAGAWVGFNDQRITMGDAWGQGARNALLIVGDFFQQTTRENLVSSKTKFSAPHLPPEQACVPSLHTPRLVPHAWTVPSMQMHPSSGVPSQSSSIPLHVSGFGAMAPVHVPHAPPAQDRVPCLHAPRLLPHD